MIITLLEMLEKFFVYGAACFCLLFFVGILGLLYEHVGIFHRFVDYLIDLTRMTNWEDEG